MTLPKPLTIQFSLRKTTDDYRSAKTIHTDTVNFYPTFQVGEVISVTGFDMHNHHPDNVVRKFYKVVDVSFMLQIDTGGVEQNEYTLLVSIVEAYV